LANKTSYFVRRNPDAIKEEVLPAPEPTKPEPVEQPPQTPPPPETRFETLQPKNPADAPKADPYYIPNLGDFMYPLGTDSPNTPNWPYTGYVPFEITVSQLDVLDDLIAKQVGVRVTEAQATVLGAPLESVQEFVNFYRTIRSFWASASLWEKACLWAYFAVYPGENIPHWPWAASEASAWTRVSDHFNIRLWIPYDDTRRFNLLGVDIVYPSAFELVGQEKTQFQQSHVYDEHWKSNNRSYDPTAGILYKDYWPDAILATQAYRLRGAQGQRYVNPFDKEPMSDTNIKRELKIVVPLHQASGKPTPAGTPKDRIRGALFGNLQSYQSGFWYSILPFFNASFSVSSVDPNGKFTNTGKSVMQARANLTSALFRRLQSQPSLDSVGNLKAAEYTRFDVTAVNRDYMAVMVPGFAYPRGGSWKDHVVMPLNGRPPEQMPTGQTLRIGSQETVAYRYYSIEEHINWKIWDKYGGVA